VQHNKRWRIFCEKHSRFRGHFGPVFVKPLILSCNFPPCIAPNFVSTKTQTMTKHFFSLALLCALALPCTIQAQSTPKSHGKLNISAGVGIVPAYTGTDSKGKFLPVSLRVGYAIGKKLHVSGFFGYSNTTSNPRLFADGFSSKLENKSMTFGLRTEVRKDLTSRVDLYGGAMLGYSHSDVKEYEATTGQLFLREPGKPTPYNPNAPDGQVIYAAFVGSTFYLNKSFGFFGEVGFGVSIANLGVTLRL
jgi:hypothetical protein